MLDEQQQPDTTTPVAEEPASRPRRRRAVSRPAGPPAEHDAVAPLFAAPVAAPPAPAAPEPAASEPAEPEPAAPEPAEPQAAPRTRRRASRRAAGSPQPAAASDAAVPAADEPTAADAAAPAPAAPAAETPAADAAEPAPAADEAPRSTRRRRKIAVAFAAPTAAPDAAGDEAPAPVAAAAALSVPLFQPPPEAPVVRRRRPAVTDEDTAATDAAATDTAAEPAPSDDTETEPSGRSRRRRRRGRDKDQGGDTADTGTGESADATPDSDGDDDTTGTRRRRRRRRGSGSDDGVDAKSDDPGDGVTALKGSTRIEAKKQRRKEGRESGRRRTPVLSEAEFLARRESVTRTMVIRQQGSLTQIAVLEDGVLVEHYVNQATATSLVGNVYLGRVQNVLPSMEAAFVDIGRGRNAVLYAGEVNWDAAGLEGQPKRIEQALSSGDKVLVQVTKDPIGHKGARLTSQVSLPGRFLVYVPDGSVTGISRKLPDTERSRLRGILRGIIPDGAGVIVRTASEGAAEDDLVRDVEQLKKRWESIQTKQAKGNAPSMLYSEPDLALRIVRDVFNSDFESLVVSGSEIGDTLDAYIAENAPALSERVSRWTAPGDVFAEYRVTEQLAKALDRKVYLPSGGSLVIDRTEAMTVVDVNTGRFTGQGGNLEETVTRNNLEAAEEIVRQIRLRDIGGIIVVDFIDMVLESNRDLVLRRLVECLGRDRTKHQVAEVTSLGLVQMTRKRIGQGLLETFSEPCDCCNGRGVKVHTEPVEGRGTKERPKRPTRPPGAHDPVEAAAARTRDHHDESAAPATGQPAAETSADTPAGLTPAPDSP